MAIEIPTAPDYNLTQTDVCNNALDLIGAQSIGDLAEDTRAGNLCRRQFPSILSAMLRDHDWNFATRRVYLPRIDPDVVAQFLLGFGSGGFGGGGFGGGGTSQLEITEPSGGFAFWYALPGNFLRAWSINARTGCHDGNDFTIEFGTLQTDAETALLRYTAYVEDPNLWDAMFRLGIETYLASRLAGPLTGDLQLANNLMIQALGGPGIMGIFSQAKAVVGQEGSIYSYTVTDLTTDIREL